MSIASKPKLAVTAPKSPDEQTLKVKMPQGSTERSKKLIAKQKQTAATAAGRFELLVQNKNTYTPVVAIRDINRALTKKKLLSEIEKLITDSQCHRRRPGPHYQGCQNKLATGAFHLLFRILRQLLRMLVGQLEA